MEYALTINERNLELFQRSLLYRFDQAKTFIEQAMGEKCFEIVRSNFGDFGVDRPIDWAPLSPAYAKKVGRDHATLFVTGKLESSVKFESTPDFAKVSISDSDVEYATDHQYGNPSKHLPARPYFPLDANNNVTPFTQEQVYQAAREETARLIGGGVL